MSHSCPIHLTTTSDILLFHLFDYLFSKIQSLFKKNLIKKRIPIKSILQIFWRKSCCLVFAAQCWPAIFLLLLGVLKLQTSRSHILYALSCGLSFCCCFLFFTCLCTTLCTSCACQVWQERSLVNRNLWLDGPHGRGHLLFLPVGLREKLYNVHTVWLQRPSRVTWRRVGSQFWCSESLSGGNYSLLLTMEKLGLLF